MRGASGSTGYGRLLTVAALICACGSGGGASGGGDSGSDDGANDGGAADGGGGNAIGEELVGRWWGHLPETALPIVLEVPGTTSAGGVRARIWKNGAATETSLGQGVISWQFDGNRILDCKSLTVDASHERMDLHCGQDGKEALVLRRSHATRIYEAPVRAAALGFDATGARFAFANLPMPGASTNGTPSVLARFWSWDTTVAKLSDLGDGTAFPGSRVVYSPDGQRMAYLTGSPGSLFCKTARLTLFDAASGQSQIIATDTPCTAGFAQFSADGQQLVYFGHDAGDDTGADLLHWSTADGTSTLIASKTGSAKSIPYYVFGSSGKRLIFRPSTALELPEPLSTYDFSSKAVTIVATAAQDITPSPDRAYVGFADAAGDIRVWQDALGSTKVLFHQTNGPIPQNYHSGLTVSPDSRRYAFLNGDNHGAAYAVDPDATGGAISLGSAGIQCYYDHAAERRRAAYFAPDGTGLLYWPTAQTGLSDCFGGDPSGGFAWSDLTGKKQLGGIRLGSFFSLGPHGEAVSFNLGKVQFWSPELGFTNIMDVGILEPFWAWGGAQFAQKGAELIFRLTSSEHSALWQWDATTASSRQIALAAPGLDYRLDADSGQVVLAENTPERPLALWTPGDTAPHTLLDQTDTQLVSDSGHAIAAHGKRAADQAIFAFRFGSQQATLIEEGAILGLSDTHVYFQAPDGVCVEAY
jgi:hypothetical protein